MRTKDTSSMNATLEDFISQIGEKVVKVENIFDICYFRARQNYGSNFGIILRVTKNSEFVMKNSQKCFLNHINIFEYLSMYVHACISTNLNGIGFMKRDFY